MAELLSSYSLTEIVLLIALVALGIKELVEFIDWLNERGKQHYDNSKDKLNEQIENLGKLLSERKDLDDADKKKINEHFAKIDDEFEKINQNIAMLIESDKENIKHDIVAAYHLYSKGQVPIDDYTMDCLEKRFAIYEREHGNSFVKAIMDDLREWHKQSVN